MPSAYAILDPLRQIHPGRFIAQFQDWITFTLLLIFFISIAGLTLHRRFENNKYAKPLVISVGLILTFGTHFSIYKGWLNLSFQGFGMLGAVMVFIIIFFVFFGLVKGFGMDTSKALPLSFALLYISLYAVSPNIFDTIAKVFPPLNLILLILWLYSIYKLITAFFKHSGSPTSTLKNLAKLKPLAKQERESEKDVKTELKGEEKERKMLKHKTPRITKLEIKSTEAMLDNLDQMVRIVQVKGNNVDQEEIGQLTHNLRKIYGKEDLLRKGLLLMKSHVKAYRQLHKKNIDQLTERYNATKDPKQRRTIDEEIRYQKRMLEVIGFLESYEGKIQEFVRSFNRDIYTAIQKVKSQNPQDALSYMTKARSELQQMLHIHEKQRDLENYLLKVNKKTILDLKKEKRGN